MNVPFISLPVPGLNLKAVEFLGTSLPEQVLASQASAAQRSRQRQRTKLVGDSGQGRLASAGERMSIGSQVPSHRQWSVETLVAPFGEHPPGPPGGDVCVCGGGICRRAWGRRDGQSARILESQAQPSLSRPDHSGSRAAASRTLRARILLRRQFPFPGLQASLRQFLRGARDYLLRRGGEA